MSKQKLAALIFSSISIPGDERSRTHPGHGYPAHEVTQIELKEFRDEAEMEAWVKQETTGYRSTKFKLIRYEELTYSTTVQVKVK